jgi:Cupredoxin-like domain
LALNVRAEMNKLPVFLVMVAMFSAAPVRAETPEIVLEIQNHLFQPDVIRIPANTKVKLVIFNRDPTPEEFESYELNREKVIMGGSKAIVFIGPLLPGEYPFFGEFNPQTALGKVIVENPVDAAE